MKATISYVVVFASLVVTFGIHPSIFVAEEEASSIMRNGGVVNIGDMDVTVQEACGEPNTKGMNQWVYNFGPSQPFTP